MKNIVGFIFPDTSLVSEVVVDCVGSGIFLKQAYRWAVDFGTEHKEQITASP